MIYLHTKFHMSNCVCLISYCHKRNAKYRLNMVAILYVLFYTKNYAFIYKVHIFEKNITNIIYCIVTVSLPPDNLLRPSCWYYWLCKIV